MKMWAYYDNMYAQKPLAYLFNFISNWLGIPIDRLEGLKPSDEHWVFVYADLVPDFLTGHSKIIHIIPSGFFTEEYYLKRSSLPTRLSNYQGIPFLEFPAQGAWDGNRKPDFLAGSFFLLTCYEEFISCGTRDRRQRRNFDSLLSSQLNTLEKPIIDQWLCLIRDTLRSQPAKSENALWNGHPFAFVITRDIDTLTSKYPFSWIKFAKSLLSGNFMAYLKSAKKFIGNNDDRLNNLEQIFSWEQQHQLRSSNYFLASEEVGDANYSIEEVGSRRVIQQMKDGGWELGFHPGAAAYQDTEKFLQQKEKLNKAFNQVAIGGRQHGLRFSNPHTWRLWQDNGFLYDSTLGFAEHEGFKAGTCRPYFLYDLLENEVLNLVEFPLTLMDCTLDKYRKLSMDEMEKVAMNLLKSVEEVNGVFILLWHNSYFGESNIGHYHSILEKLVLTAKKNNGWIATASEVNNFWRNRVSGLRS